MRRIGFALLASVALIGGAAAADMPVKAPVYKAPVIAPPYNWTGFYVGGHIGGAWSNVDISDPTGAVFAPLGATIGADGNGFLGGGQIGFNWQTGHWVFGVQGDMAWTGINTSVVDPFLPTMTLNYKTDWIAMLTGRVGYAWDNWLLYAKGGAAWVHSKYSATGTSPFAPIGFSMSGADTRDGWVAGAGVEYGITPNWTAFIEYDYVGLGTRGITLSPPVIAANVNQNISIVKGGINFKFMPF